jgi:hypothetical protein
MENDKCLLFLHRDNLRESPTVPLFSSESRRHKRAHDLERKF